jgi:hypothetical protein
MEGGGEATCVVGGNQISLTSSLQGRPLGAALVVDAPDKSMTNDDRQTLERYRARLEELRGFL